MGCGASAAKSSPQSRRTMNDGNQPQRTASTLMASLQGHMSNGDLPDDQQKRTIRTIELTDGVFSERLAERIECDDIVEFKITGKGEYDIVQVYKDGTDFYRVHNGFELLNIKNRTPATDRRILLSFGLTQLETDIYFCIISSKDRQLWSNSQKCPKERCEHNHLIVRQLELKFSLTDHKDNKKVYLHRGDTVQCDWLSEQGVAYRMEERKYCPVSGGFYTVKEAPDDVSSRASPKGQFSKKFNDFGMSFLVRLDDKNHLHDITVCIVDDTYKMKYIEITDDKIQPNVIWIEQADWIVFEWTTKRKQSVVQIEPFAVDAQKQESIQLKTKDGNLVWPKFSSRRGHFYHQFNETGIFCFKTENNQIGTIIVEPRKTIYHIPLFAEEKNYQIKTDDLIQFDWKMISQQDKAMSITIDADSSVVPDSVGGLRGLFDCAQHKCAKAEAVLAFHLYTCETYLLTIPQHGLYNFALSDSPDEPLMSIIIENGIDNHRVVYDDKNEFERPTIVIEQFDQVWFDSSSGTVASIHATDEHGHPSESEPLLFQPQPNSINYYVKRFDQLGIYYFSTDLNQKNKQKRSSAPARPLAVIVLPKIRFHYKLIGQDQFDSEPIVTHVNDFVFWRFDGAVSCNVIQLGGNETLEDLASSHDRMFVGRSRQCLAVECVMPGTFFFVNPEFERIAGAEQKTRVFYCDSSNFSGFCPFLLDRLVSTVIIDPLFSQNSFVIAKGQFLPSTLSIAQNDTVSWTLPGSGATPQIFVEANDVNANSDEDGLMDRNIAEYIHGIRYLHTFQRPGQYTIRSDAFRSTATVYVLSADAIQSQRNRVQEPVIESDIETVSDYDTQIELSCANSNAAIHYTLDGSIPTKHIDSVEIYDPTDKIRLLEPGLHVLRAYASEPKKLSSDIVTSSLTFVKDNPAGPIQPVKAATEWNHCKLNLSASLKKPNTIWATVDIQPEGVIDLIDHLVLHINNVAQKVHLSPTDAHFSAEGFAAGEEYEIYVTAYPKDDAMGQKTFSSNKKAFRIEPYAQDGAPLISLGVANDPNTFVLMWAHVGDRVSEYLVYVNNVLTKKIGEQNFDDYYGIEFTDAQPQRNYQIRVEAKMRGSEEIRKSNAISVDLPLVRLVNAPFPERYVPYISVKRESNAPDARLEPIHHEDLQGTPNNRNIETLPIDNDVNSRTPTISFRNNLTGATFICTDNSPNDDDYVDHYRIMVDGKDYGQNIKFKDTSKFQVNLAPGKHECYLDVIPKDAAQKIYKSNLVKIDVPPRAAGLKREQKQMSSVPIDQFFEAKDIPIPKLSVQTMNASSLRATWYLDRPVHTDAFVAMYEVHVRGPEFLGQIASDQKFKENGYTEHVWFVSKGPLEITGISDQHAYTVFICALFHVRGSNDTKYVISNSNEFITTVYDPLIDLLTRPLLKIDEIGLQSATLSWTLDESVDPSLIKGFRVVLNSKPTEILSPDQHEYELQDLKPGTTNEIQVSATAHRDFADEKISDPIRVVCPRRPLPPVIESTPYEKPYCIGIRWKRAEQEQDETTTFRIFLDGDLHHEMEINGRHSFKYDLTKLQANRMYRIHVKSVVGQKKLDGYSHQCSIESNASNELTLDCAAPPKGATPRIERMHANGIEIVWDPPAEDKHFKLTGYQILKNGRALGKPLPHDKRRASISSLELGNQYLFQIVPITDLPGTNALRTGEQYDSIRHEYCLPGSELEIEFKDIIEPPKKIWIENVSGHAAMLCWSPMNTTSDLNTRPDNFKISMWNNKGSTRAKPNMMAISNDKTSTQLKDLDSDTTYEIQFEACKKRRHPKTKESYIVSSTSDLISFHTGAPPDAPSHISLVACTNNAARIAFDPFVEHNAEIVGLRVQCEPISSATKAKEILMDLTPDATECILSNLTEQTTYHVKISGVTDEYLTENRCRDVVNLPRNLKTSVWLPTQSLKFVTSGCMPATQVSFRSATTECIQLEWKAPEAFGSTEYLGQVLRWKLEPGEESQMELDRNAVRATIPGVLPSGIYKIWLDSLFRAKISLEDTDEQTNNKEIRLTTAETVRVHLHIASTCDEPTVYLTGYTKDTIDIAWSKPNMFYIVDHPEKINEQVKVHRRLLGYRVDIDGKERQTLDEGKEQCSLGGYRPGQEYKVQVIAKTSIERKSTQNESIVDGDEVEPVEKTPSKTLCVRMLEERDLLRSLSATFEYHHRTNANHSSLGQIHVQWTVSNGQKSSHYILQWHSSKDLQIQQKIIAKNDLSAFIEPCDEKHFYVINLIIVMDDGTRYQSDQVTLPIPGPPDAPKLWLAKTSDISFRVEWSEPQVHGIPIIGYQLFIEGKKAGSMQEISLRRAEIPSCINRVYQVSICAVTNHPQRVHSEMSETLTVITTPTTNLVPTMAYHNDDGSGTSLDASIARIIPLQIESINEEKLHCDWTSFMPNKTVRAYYIHYTCLNNGEVQSMKVSKRNREAVLRDLRPGFTYGIMIMAVDKDGGVLFTSDRRTIQMNAPPNAPIVAISARTNNHVKVEWRPAASYGELSIGNYKIFINDRLAAILPHDQLTYTLTKGKPCEIYTVNVQAVSNNKRVISPMSRTIQFAWPGVKPGAFRRLDDGQAGLIKLAWEHPQLEDKTEKLIGFKLFSEHVATHAFRLCGEFDAATNQATINDLGNGNYRLWLEIETENYCVRARPITVKSGRFTSLVDRPRVPNNGRCFLKKANRVRGSTMVNGMPPIE